MSKGSILNGTVKSVLSGDTVVLLGQSKGGPPPEMQLTLANLQAPRLARHPSNTDEPFAWESREFLRKLLIGKPVQFKVEYKRDTASGSRSFGAIRMSDGRFAEVVVAEAGWARADSERAAEERGQGQHYEEVAAAAAEAQARGLGVHVQSEEERQAAVRSLKWDVEDPRGLLAQLKGIPTDGVVEYVSSGSSMRVLLPDSMQMITLLLAGVSCPRVSPRPSAAGEESKPEPHALEARHFSAVRLLNRDVQVIVAGTDQYGNFVGRVEHPAGDIATELLRAGLARSSNRSIGLVDRALLPGMRAAEGQARDNRLRVWSTWSPPVITGARHIAGQVVEVVSGDSIVVLSGSPSAAAAAAGGGGSTGGVEHRVFLSSIRAPRLGRMGGRGGDSEPFALKAREELRKMLIGKSVRVQVDYTRDPPASAPRGDKRRFGTVTYENSSGVDANPSVRLVSEGLVGVIRHRADEVRAPNYDELMELEEAAKEKALRIHGNTEGMVSTRATDFSNNPSAARSSFSVLQRRKVVHGLVEKTFGGSRFKLYLPSEKFLITFAIAGVRCPAAARKESTAADGRKLAGRPGEPFGAEAAAHARETLQQREVEFSVEDQDRNGTFLGSLFVGGGAQRRSVGVELLRAGLAKRIPGVSDRVTEARALEEAEEEARSMRRGLWQFEEEVEEAAEAAQEGDEFFSSTACDVRDGTTVVLHSDTDAGSLRRVQAAMDDMRREFGTRSLPVTTGRGKMVAALFDDGSGMQWFRARLLRPRGVETWEVLYVDYGNVGSVDAEEMRPLPASVASVPPLGRVCQLAFIRAPELATELGTEAGRALSGLVMGKPLVAKVHGMDKAQNCLTVSLFDKASGDSIAEQLVAAGLARVSAKQFNEARRRTGMNKREARQAVLEAERSAAGATPGPLGDLRLIYRLLDEQKAVKRKRTGWWRYGDVGDSDDEA